MKAAGWPSYGTDLMNPNFAKLAESADIKGIRVEAPEDLRPALRAALDHDGPCLVDVKVNRQELAMPPTIKMEQALGFSLYMMRAVLSGRGDEVIDLVATNLLSRLTLRAATKSSEQQLFIAEQSEQLWVTNFDWPLF